MTEHGLEQALAGMPDRLDSRRHGRLVERLLAERDRWGLWLPVLFGAGIGLYFALPSEPRFWPPVVVAILLCGAAFVGRSRPAFVTMIIAVGAVAAGVMIAKLRVEAVAAPILAREVGPLPVTGRVVDIDRLEEGTRLLLDGVAFSARDVAAPPARVRVRLRGPHEIPPAGAIIRIPAVLAPPPEPVAPGAFDFARQLYFERIGAVGYAVGAPEILEPAQWGLLDGVHIVALDLRQRLGERIAAHLDGAAGAIATALLTGDQLAIPEAVMQDMRASGLAHLLSISGLHVGLVAGFVFFLVRAALAVSERAALRWPIKKIAAVAGIAAACFYTILVGAPVPTQRSMLTTGIVLLAVIVDRNPFSLRLVAFVATAILILSPESLLGASFQMSFAAVIALVAGFEAVQRHWIRWRSSAGLAGRLGLYLGGLALTSLLAGLATLPFSMFHFQQIQTYGLLANMAAVPLTSFWVMPMALLAILLLPLGLEDPAFAAMGMGLEAIMAVAAWTADLPGATVPVPAAPVWTLAAFALGGLWLALWERRRRLLGLLPVLAGVGGVAFAHPPDLLVDGEAKLVAIRDASGDLSLSSRVAARFDAEVWRRRNGQEPKGAKAWPRYGPALDGALRCDPVGCLWTAPSGTRVAIVKEREGLAEDCRHADLVVSLEPAGRCPAPLVIDRFSLWRKGAHALTFGRDGITVATVRDARGNRPWVLPRGQQDR